MMFPSGWFSARANGMAIDLGTVNTIVYVHGRGVVLNEPSVVAIDHRDGAKKLCAIGTEAKLMVGRTPQGLTTVRPMRDGVITDIDVAEQMITEFIRRARAGAGGLARRPHIVICIPSGATQVERRAIRQAATSAGAASVRLMQESMAAAIGAGLPVNDPTGTMIVDVGGGTTEIAVISLSNVVHHSSLRIGGDKMDEAIASTIRRSHSLTIGEATAERIKQTIGSSRMPEPGASRTMTIRGRNIVSGFPDEIKLDQIDIAGSLSDLVDQIVYGAIDVLSRTDPELAADIHSEGIMMTGGASQLSGLSAALALATGVPVRVASKPLMSVAMGAGRALEDPVFASTIADN